MKPRDELSEGMFVVARTCVSSAESSALTT
jgi:hypothetical protein